MHILVCVYLWVLPSVFGLCISCLYHRLLIELAKTNHIQTKGRQGKLIRTQLTYKSPERPPTFEFQHSAIPFHSVLPIPVSMRCLIDQFHSFRCVMRSKFKFNATTSSLIVNAHETATSVSIGGWRVRGDGARGRGLCKKKIRRGHSPPGP